MPRQRIHTDHAPAAIGPYSQGIRAGNLLFTAGQIALDPATGLVVEGGVTEQTHRVIENLRAILRAGGSDLDRVVKTTVYLASMADFAAMNEVYSSYFTGEAPARSTVAVSTLPRNVLVEIDAIAEVREHF